MAQVTIRDVAAACGVSIGTVSKALNRNERISEETVKRIRTTAQEMGYTGFAAARLLSARRRRIAVVLVKDTAGMHVRYLAGIRSTLPTLAAYGIECDIFYYGEDFVPFTEESSSSYEGIVALSSLAGRLGSLGNTPLVLLRSRSSAADPIAEVTPNYRVMGRLAAQFLAFATAGGEVAVLCGRRGIFSEEETVRGFREISEKLSFPLVGIAECGESPRQASFELRRLLQANARLRGLFIIGISPSSVLSVVGESKKKMTVLSTDFSQDSIEALRTGRLSALLYSSPEKQAEEALLAMKQGLLGGAVERHLAVRPELVLKSNLECYL